MRMMTAAIVLLSMICLGSCALANTGTSLVMHYVETQLGPCEIQDPCPNPAVNAPLGATIAAYLIVRNHTEVGAMQTAFEWGQWTFLFGLWDCQMNQVNGTVPAPPGGPTAGTIATAFDCLAGPSSAVIGRMHLVVTGSGCITQTMSSFPFGSHVVSCTGDVMSVDPSCWGSVCAPSGGIDACASCACCTPVEPTTWGNIKRHQLP